MTEMEVILNEFHLSSAFPYIRKYLVSENLSML